jgi:N-acetylmuramoyl-L-alanine amidase
VKKLLVCLVICTLMGMVPVSITASPILTPTDFVIDIGHGGIDGGSTHGSLLEKDINLQIGILLEKKLRNQGIHAVLTRQDDRALSDDNHWANISSRHKRDLAQRKLFIDQLQPKAVISLHCNWSKNPTKRGPVILYKFNQQSYILANLLQSSLNQLYSTSSPPFYGKKFYLLNHSSKPAVIVEMGFISNAEDRDMLTQPKKQQFIADSISSALSEYLQVFHYG